MENKIKWGQIGVAALLLSVPIVFYVNHLYHTSLVNPPSKTILIRLPQGMGLRYLIRHLKERKLLRHPKLSMMIAKRHLANQQLTRGEYAITPGMHLSQLIDAMVNHRVYWRKITFPEGISYHTMLQLIRKDSHIQPPQDTVINQYITQQLHMRPPNLEGLFFPETYYYTWGDNQNVILMNAFKHMQAALTKAWKNRAPGLPYPTAYQALIVASLLEKETAVEEERPRITGVILNRLRKQMRLQIDASVIYGLPSHHGHRVTLKELKHDSPYNTYKHHGLPPTPICLPGHQALWAALHPQSTPFLYYVARGDGTHQFSKTYSEHIHAKNKNTRHQQPALQNQ